MSIKFLLVSQPGDSAWPQVLSQALAPLGTLEVVSKVEAAEWIAQHQCRTIVIIDATAVGEDVPTLVSHLRHRCPESRIVVATASPTWRHARDAFRTGAVDYIRKSWDGEELLTAIREILGESLPPKGETS